MRKILFVLISVFITILLFLTTESKAETLEYNQFVGRTAITSSYDSVSSSYNLTGTVYNQAGRLDVDINIPANMWQGSFVVVYFPMGELSHYMLIRKDNQSTFESIYFNYLYDNNGYLHLYTAFGPDNSSISNLDSFKMNMSDGSWYVDLDNVSGKYFWDTITPCNIIYSKDCSTYFTQHTPSLAQHSTITILDYTTFEVPTLSLSSGSEFTLNLNGFGFYGQQFDNRFNTNTVSFKYELEHLYYTVYDYNTSSTIIPLTDIINDITITTDGSDSVTGYPIQSTELDFYTFFPTLHGANTDKDVLIVFTPIFKTTYRFSDMSNTFITNNWYLNTSGINYWRYRYDASNYTASLVAVDSDGNTIEPDNPEEEEENKLDYINNTISNIDQFLTNDSADNISTSDFGVTQPTVQGIPDLTSVFTQIYTAFTSVYEGDNYSFTFKIPHNNTVFTYSIPVNALSSKLPIQLLSLLQIFWWVVFGTAVMNHVLKIAKDLTTFHVDANGRFLENINITTSEFVLKNILR